MGLIALCQGQNCERHQRQDARVPDWAKVTTIRLGKRRVALKALLGKYCTDRKDVLRCRSPKLGKAEVFRFTCRSGCELTPKQVRLRDTNPFMGVPAAGKEEVANLGSAPALP